MVRARQSVLAAMTVLSVAFTSSAGDAPAAPPDAPEQPCPIDAFVASHTFADWLALKAAAQTGRCAGTAIPDVVEYSLAASSRDLPNAGAHRGTRADDYTKQQSVRAEQAFARIRKAPAADVGRLLVAMAAQTFDDELVFVAAELTARLVPQRFDALAEDTVKSNPGTAPIFAGVRERWLTAKPPAN